MDHATLVSDTLAAFKKILDDATNSVAPDEKTQSAKFSAWLQTNGDLPADLKAKVVANIAEHDNKIAAEIGNLKLAIARDFVTGLVALGLPVTLVEPKPTAKAPLPTVNPDIVNKVRAAIVNNPSTHFAVEALATMSGVTEDQTKSAIKVLKDKNIIQCDGRGRGVKYHLAVAPVAPVNAPVAGVAA